MEENRRAHQGEDPEMETKRKNEERERKKAEVRKRMEEAGRAKKAKKGFLTPERKKKLRKLLMMKAAEDLKQQQLMKEKERQKTLQDRTMSMPKIDTIDSQDELEKIYKEMYERILKLEEEKYDINHLVREKDFEIDELNIAVNDLRGKFVKPSLKKVSKYDNKFKKMADQKKDDKQDFRSNLKVVKKENVVNEMLAKIAKTDKPEWSKKEKGTVETKTEVADEPDKDEVDAEAEGEADEEEEGEEEEEEEEE